MLSEDGLTKFKESNKYKRFVFLPLTGNNAMLIEEAEQVSNSFWETHVLSKVNSALIVLEKRNK